MENSQAKLLIALGKRLKAEKTEKNKVISSFLSAGILNKNTEITKKYSTVKKALELSSIK